MVHKPPSVLASSKLFFYRFRSLHNAQTTRFRAPQRTAALKLGKPDGKEFAWRRFRPHEGTNPLKRQTSRFFEQSERGESWDCKTLSRRCFRFLDNFILAVCVCCKFAFVILTAVLLACGFVLLRILQWAFSDVRRFK